MSLGNSSFDCVSNYTDTPSPIDVSTLEDISLHDEEEEREGRKAQANGGGGTGGGGGTNATSKMSLLARSVCNLNKFTNNLILYVSCL